MIVYYEGEFVSENEAKVPITDRGFLFGDGAYATIQVRNGAPRFLEMHLERLVEQCQNFNLHFPTICPKIIDQLIEKNGAQEGIWRLKIVVTGGDHRALHLPMRYGRVLITLQSFESASCQPLKIGIFSHAFNLCHGHYKSLAHLNRYYVMEEAKQQGMDDCLTLTEKGKVLELSFGNLFWVINKQLFTPSRQLPLYFGVTLTQVIKKAKELGYTIHEVEVGLDELPEDGEYFRTNSMGGVRPICQIGTILCSKSTVVLEA